MQYVWFGMGVGFVITFLLTPLLRHFGHRRGLFDAPERRKVHREPVPRTGGIGLFFGVLIPLLLLLPHGPETHGFLAGLAILAAVGIVDDTRSLNASSKLPFQVLAAWMMVGFGGVRILHLDLPGLGVWQLPELFSIAFTMLCVLALINAMNLIDGLDGLAGGIGGVIFGSLLVMGIVAEATPVMLVGAVFLGSLAAFLWFNRHPATIFMGDTGSTLIGFGLAYACIKLVFSPNPVSTWVPVALLALPMFDMTAAILRRLWQGRSPFSPDRGHIHHRLVRSGVSHPDAVRILWGVNLLLCGQAVLLAHEGMALMLLTGVTLVAFYLMIRWQQGLAMRSLRAVRSDARSRRRD